MNFPDSYELIQEKQIEEFSAHGVLLSHRKTGARVFLLETDDENKVYDIAFRTPPEDDSGIPHILEHSVLCGSDRFPLKDPFVELAKGSMNTFLNALTYPEKTMYPVASVNDRDFANLMAVYTDAVFCPNIRNTDLIFRQEGWHYELDSAEDELKINGVVYNEMRGARFSRIHPMPLSPAACRTRSRNLRPSVSGITTGAIIIRRTRIFTFTGKWIIMSGWTGWTGNI